MQLTRVCQQPSKHQAKTKYRLQSCWLSGSQGTSMLGSYLNMRLAKFRFHFSGQSPNERWQKKHASPCSRGQILKYQWYQWKSQAFNGEKAIVMDGMVMVRILKPSGTFNEFSSMLLDKVIDEATGYSRVDVVFDVYDSQSIKSDKRTKRGSQKMCNIRILNRAMNIQKRLEWFPHQHQ